VAPQAEPPRRPPASGKPSGRDRRGVIRQADRRAVKRCPGAQQFVVEAAQVALGHSRADVTQVYAERDLALARRVAAEAG
jgi:predicted outer membrane protein